MTDTIIEVQETSEGQPVPDDMDPVEDATVALDEKFPGEITPDSRERFSGLIISPERWR